MNLQIFYDDIFPYAGDRPSRDKLDALAAGAVPCCGAVRCRLEDHWGPAEHRLQTELGGLRHGNILREEMPVIGEGEYPAAFGQMRRFPYVIRKSGAQIQASQRHNNDTKG